MRIASVWLLALLGAACAACSARSEVRKELGPPGDAHQIGRGDGSPSSVDLVIVYQSDTPRQATDLAFNPLRPNELWVLLREFVDGPPCTHVERHGCAELEGSVAIVRDPGGSQPVAELKKDENAWHFMRTPTGIAFGDNGNFSTCSEHRTGNYDDDTPDYNGPTLWSSDPAIFTITPPGGNGSHIDMLHESPYAMGIAHEHANVYWVYNGKLGALDRYDFMQPHQPGAEDHSDGQLLRYAEGSLKRQPGVPGHLVVEPERGRVYVADTGNRRVVALEPAGGAPVQDLAVLEPMQLAKSIGGARLIEVVAPGVLEAPSGVAIADNVLFVTDNGTSKIHAFDLDGNPLRTLDTGLPAGTLAGIAIGPDDRAYLADIAAAKVRRIDVH